MTLADILIPLAGSISNERAIKMREACDALEAKIDIAQRGSNYAHDLISSLTERVKELERDNLDRRLTKLESAVDVLDRQRVETLKLRVNGLEHTQERHQKGLEFIEYERVSPLEDRVSMLESATKNTGEGTSTHEGDVCSDRESAPDAPRNTPSPASSVPANATGEVPEWMPSAEEMDRLWAQTAAGCILRGVAGSGAAWSAVIDLIASRAPDAPVSVVTMRMYCPYCGWLGEKRSNHSESNADALAHAETCELNPRRAMERRIAELESAPAAPVVDVEMLVRSYHTTLGTSIIDLHPNGRLIDAMSTALKSQGVRTKDGAP